MMLYYNRIGIGNSVWKGQTNSNDPMLKYAQYMVWLGLFIANWPELDSIERGLGQIIGL